MLILLFYRLINKGIDVTQELRCPRCGANYSGNVTEWLSYVKCSYCGASIPIPKKEMQVPQQVIVVAPPEDKRKPKKFVLCDFAEFISKKGYSMDPISGVVVMGPATLYINENGTVEGPEPFRTKMEKWIYEYMKT